MSEDIDPTLGLDDGADESIDTQPSFENDSDLSGPMGMSEFDPNYPGLDPDNSGTGWTEGGSGTSGSGASTESDGDGWGTLGTGSESGSAGGSSGSGESTGSSSEADSDNWMKGAMGSGSDSGSDAGPPDTPGAETTSSTEQFETEETTTSSSSSDEETTGDTSGQPGDLTVSIDGENIAVGPPTLDITGDGVADTVVVESEGNVEYYVDTDQDGVADQIIVLDEQDGTLVNHEVYDPTSGTWTNVTADSSGNS